MFNSGAIYSYSDPTTQRMYLEQQKQQLEREFNQVQTNIQGIQQRYGMVCAQIKALDSYLSQPAQAPTNPQAAIMEHLGQTVGQPGLTQEQLQAALASQDGQALSKLVSDEIQAILQRQAGVKPPAAPN